ncbi:MAG: serine hydrolase domain-containing protein [Candidatus Aminicenantes bacterium]
MNKKILKGTFASVMVFVLLCSSLVFAESLTDQVDKLFSEWDKPDSPGCALAIIKDGRFIYKRGYGMANLDYDLPIHSKSIFRIGSTSKQFTAMCVLLLEEEGKLSLDDDIRKYIPEMPEYENAITIRHLLHHTSGIRDYLELLYLAGARSDDFYVDGEVVALIARQKELNFNPGDEYLYSNSGYFLLSEIVKRVTGRSMRDYAEEKIFNPLGMANTHFHNDHTMVVKNRATGYSPKKEGGFRISVTNLDMIGDGGIFICVEDLLLWDEIFYRNKLGEAAQEPITRMITPGVLNNGETIDYGLGLVVSQYRGLKMISHGGAFVGYRAEMIRFPEQKFSVIVLANLNSINPSRLARKVADIYLADEFEEESVPEKPQFIKLPESELKQKAGVYHDKKTDQVMKVLYEEGQLLIDASGMRIKISPVSKTRFRAVEAPVDLEVEFKKQAQGKPVLALVRMDERESMTYEAIQVVSPTSAQLMHYVGDYFSGELQVTYKIELEEGKLFLRHENPYKNYPENPFEPTLKDRFLVDGNHLKFFRDQDNKIESFTMNVGRVRNIRFVKK